MTDQLRYRYGESNPVEPDVDSATVIEIGDLVYQETDDTRPAASITWNINLAITQADFKAKFLGNSHSRSRNGDTDKVRVATEGVHEFDCDAATFEIGDTVGPAKQAGNALENQKVAAAVSTSAIGRVTKRYAANTTKVLVRLFADVMDGGV